jgi:hypothetical protein
LVNATQPLKTVCHVVVPECFLNVEIHRLAVIKQRMGKLIYELSAQKFLEPSEGEEAIKANLSALVRARDPADIKVQPSCVCSSFFFC